MKLFEHITGSESGRGPAILLSLALLVVAFSQGAGAENITTPPADQVEIGVRVGVLNIESIDSSREAFSANVGMKFRWFDPRLAHSESDSILVNLGEIWHPVPQLVNRMKVSSTIPPQAVIAPDGTVTLTQRVRGEFSQPLELREFPLDSQQLEIQVVAVGAFPEQIRFVPIENEPSGIHDEITLSDWKVTGYRLNVEPYRFFGNAPPTSAFSFQIDVERLRGYYAFKIFVPLLLIILMAYMVLWIPMSAATTRISVSVTAMLTLMAYRFMVDGLLPRISYLTRLDIFVMLATFIVFGAVVVAVVTAFLLEYDRDHFRVNRLARMLFPVLIVLIMGVAFFPY